MTLGPFRVVFKKLAPRPGVPEVRCPEILGEHLNMSVEPEDEVILAERPSEGDHLFRLGHSPTLPSESRRISKSDGAIQGSVAPGPIAGAR